VNRHERETIITFDDSKDPAHIFTYNKAWQKHLEKNLGLKPTMTNRFGGREYDIDKSRIKMPRAPKKLSAEQRENIGRRLATIRKSGKKQSSTGKNER